MIHVRYIASNLHRGARKRGFEELGYGYFIDGIFFCGFLSSQVRNASTPVLGFYWKGRRVFLLQEQVGQVDFFLWGAQRGSRLRD